MHLSQGFSTFFSSKNMEFLRFFQLKLEKLVMTRYYRDYKDIGKRGEYKELGGLDNKDMGEWG
jgi:hypothetical protein